MEYTYEDKKLGNGNTIHYKITPSGTAYKKDTPDELVRILENLRGSGTRVRFYYGDKDTGRDWEEAYDVFGTIGRSSGSIKIPLLINNTRSMGGGGLLDDAIVKVEYANKRDGGVLWQHPKYHRGDYPVQRTGAPIKTKRGKVAKRLGRGRPVGTSLGGVR